MEDLLVEAIPKRKLDDVKAFLLENDLGFDDGIEYTVGCYNDGKLIATGSFEDNVLKCIAVSDEYQGMDLSGKVVSELVKEQFNRGRTHLFLYTKPKNRSIFSGLGFTEIATTKQALLMENRPNGIKNYQATLREHFVEGENIGAVVVNCNPFTLGHRYLIEYASKASSHLHIFVVYQNNSSFPNDVRYDLVEKGVADIHNVTVHKATGYIISSATFPSYFIKDTGNIVKTHSEMDLNIFGKYIAPSLNITKRFVGTEPYSETTNIYNEAMKEVLPQYNIEVVEIERKQLGDMAISASRVRELIRTDKIEEIKSLVPQTTYAYLNSPEAREVIEKIKAKYSRH